MADFQSRIRPLDLGAIFAGAGNIMQLQQMRRQQDKQQEIDAALKAGDMNRWAQLDPVGAAKYRESQLSANKSQLDMAKSAQDMGDKRAKRTQDEAQLMANPLQQNPRMAGYFKQRFDYLAQQGAIDPIDVPAADMAHTALDPGQVGPEALPSEAEVGTAQRMAGVEDPYAKPQGKVLEFAQITGMRPGQPGFQQAFTDWDMRQRKASAVTVNNNVSAQGGAAAASPLTTANTTEQNNKLISTRETMHALGQLEKIGDPAEFLSRGSKLGQFALSEIDSLAPGVIGEDGEKFIGDAKVYRAQVQQFFNAYRKMITGAGASTKELEQLENSVLNDKMSPAEFRAMLKYTTDKARRDEKVISNLLQRNLQLGTDDFAIAFDAARNSGESPAAAGAQADAAMPQATVTTGKGKNQRTVEAPRMSTGDLRAEALRNSQLNPAWGQLTAQQQEQVVQSYIKLHGTPSR